MDFGLLAECSVADLVPSLEHENGVLQAMLAQPYIPQPVLAFQTNLVQKLGGELIGAALEEALLLV